MAEAGVAFEVIDALEDRVGLERRSPTLDGSVPLRVAQACTPLAEGNAFGFQVVLRRRIEVRRRLGGYQVVAIERSDDLARRHRAALPMLAADDLLPRGSAWWPMLRRGVVQGRPPGPARGRPALRLFTGLLVRPCAGVRLRLSGTRNRRSLAYDVREAVLDDATGFVPLVLEVDSDADGFVLTGEIATLAAHPADVEFARHDLEAAPEVARAHVAFYDAEYFATKQRGEVVHKYRREIAARASAGDSADVAARLDVIEAGPVRLDPGRPARFHRPAGPVAAGSDARSDRLVFANAIAFRACFDGLDLRVEPDPDGLAAFGVQVRARWAPTLARLAAEHPGALLYLTKYFTPHPPGEPHLFVKPAALVRTPPGVATLVEGIPGDGYDVLRGVIATDAFHAVPAVFQMRAPGQRIAVAAGTPLTALFPIPRALLAATFASRRLAEGR